LQKLSEYKKTKQLQLQRLEAINKQAKQVYDEFFVGTNHKFSISTKEALHLNDSYNNNHSIMDFDRTTLLFEDDFQAQIQTLGKFIEKTVEFFRWKVDRWRPDNIDINQHEVEKLKIEKNNYGIQSVENAYIIWKHKVKW
jgi:hypothetical protein